MKILETQRLILRTFHDHDLDAMARINQDPKVMKYFPSIGNRKQTYDHIKRIRTHQARYGYSLYAVELKSTSEMIGFVGLIHRAKKEFGACFTPATEIGWRLSSRHWGKGYATEAALAVLDYAFNYLNLDEVVSFTVVNNQASQRVMEKIGLYRDFQGDFDHPKIAKDNPLCRHVLYRLSKQERR
ncbi:MAG: GNAT family N-acetyltransferase [Pseudomonadota bacterium]